MTDSSEMQAATSGDECPECLSGRVIALAVVFALFAAYCAADFATGGRLTTSLAALVASARGGTGDS